MSSDLHYDADYGAKTGVIRAIRPGLAGIALVSLMLWLIPIGFALHAMLMLDVAMAGRSGTTVIGLTAMAVALVTALVGLSALRARLLREIGGTVHYIAAPLLVGDTERTMALDRLRGVLAGPAVPALIDLGAAPLYLLVLALMGWPLACSPLVSGTAMVVVVVVALRRTLELEEERSGAAAECDERRLARTLQADILQSLGIAGRMIEMELQASRHAADRAQACAANHASVNTRVTAIAALGMMLAGSIAVWLATQDSAGTGAVVSALVLTAFVLWPSATVARNLSRLTDARVSCRGLLDALGSHRPGPALVALPTPTRSLVVEGVALVAPGERRLLLRDVSVALTAGDVVAVGGAARVGKSMLLKSLAGVIVPAAGVIRMDGSALDQWDPATRARHIGYLPQGGELLSGTIAQNIAGFEPAADSRGIVQAAYAAGAHDMIVRLPRGYDTPISFPEHALSPSTRQRICLARACYGDPFVLLLDMPGAFQDSEGMSALAKAIIAARGRGAIVIAIGAEPAIVDNANLVLVLGKQRVLDFGPKEEVRERIKQQRQLAAGSTSPQQSMSDAVAE